MSLSARRTGNLFHDAKAPPQGERFDTLLACRNLMVERIVSSSSPEPGTYVQAQDEWVVLIRGEARLRLDERFVDLHAGDHLFIPAGVPHTVEQVSAGTLWLAVHLHQDGQGESSHAP